MVEHFMEIESPFIPLIITDTKGNKFFVDSPLIDDEVRKLLEENGYKDIDMNKIIE